MKLLLVLLSLSLTAFGAVNLKNGNFYITYSDAVVPGGGKKLSMSRTYNLTSTHIGWFGFGWGNKYETYLAPSPDGCVVIHENGSGARTRFCPKSKVDPSAAADKVISALKSKSKKQMTKSAIEVLRKKLVRSEELRNSYAKSLKLETKLAKGTLLYSNQRGMQKVKVTDTGYLRSDNDGNKDYFDKVGKFLKSKDKNGYSVEYIYKDKKLYSIKDSQAKQIFFSWYSNGFVKEMWTVGDKKATYKYKGKDLVYSKDLTGNEFEYKYDRKHNLTEIIFNPSDKKKSNSMKMEYDKKFARIVKLTDRNGDVTKYKYGKDKKAPKDHYWTFVTKKNFAGKEVTNKYEYETKTKPDGAKYTYRIVTVINNIKTETLYSECCGLPIKIARGKHVTNFEYNENGQLTKKNSTRGEFVQIKYDKKVNKISEVKNNAGWTKFSYDKKGNLTKAMNSSKQAVLLVYNRKGKITKMVDNNMRTQKRRTLSFEYNASGKPTIIAMDKIGKINVAYDNYGEIKKVSSKQGHKMALQVTQAFQNLLTIVKPAGVNLNM